VTTLVQTLPDNSTTVYLSITSFNGMDEILDFIADQLAANSE